jgi:hypothetical protein
LWRADFKSFEARGGIPVTGRAYQKLQNGPAPVEMAPLLGEMEAHHIIEIQRVEVTENAIEERIIPRYLPNLSYFSKSDIQFVDDSIRWYWDDTAKEASDESHGIAWKSRKIGDPMPYESVYLSDRTLSIDKQIKIVPMAERLGWKSA